MRRNMQKAPALKGRSFLAAGEGFEVAGEVFTPCPLVPPDAGKY